MTRNNALTTLLVGLVALSVLATSGLAFLYLRSVQKLHRLQYQTALINRNRSLMNSLANDTLQYSRKNPAIDPLLQSVGIKPKPGSSPAQGKAKP